MTKDKVTVHRSWVLPNGEMELIARDPYGNSHREFVHHQLEYLDMAGRLAMSMVERWALAAAAGDSGEDSQGRARQIPAAPAEVVERALTCAELLVSELRKRGHIVKGPTFAEMQERDDATE